MHKTKIVCNTGDHGMFEYMDTSILTCNSSNAHQGFFFKKKKKEEEEDKYHMTSPV